MPSLMRVRDDENAVEGLDVALRLNLAGPTGPFELDVALRIAAGSFVAITGPSGAGKTSLLRMIAGLAKPESGHVRIDGLTWSDSSADVDLPTYRRSIGFVFQDYALFPNMTVWRNVEYAMGKAAQRDEIVRLLQLVGLDGLAKAYPDRLSGGQKQRLALIRALARRPAVLMLDEPLSALDPEMRRRLQDELRQLHRDFGTTTLMVSHDVTEMLRVADRVIRLEEGRVVGDGSPAEMFGRADAAGSVHMFAEHVAGPDAEGVATVRIDGKPQSIRYSSQSGKLAAGDRVMLTVDSVTARRV